MVRGLALTLGWALLTVNEARSQDADSGPVFEAAVIKASPNPESPKFTDEDGPSTTSPGQWTCNNVILHQLIIKAWGLKSYELDAPRAIDAANYDIAAKIPPNTTVEQFRSMIRSLLTAHLHLTTHVETADRPIYEVSISKKGLKMQPANIDAASSGEATQPSAARRLGQAGIQLNPDASLQSAPGHAIAGVAPDGRHRMAGRQQDMVQIAALLVVRLHTEVLDKTGLTGIYNWAFEYDSGPGPATDSASAQASDVIPAYIQGVERGLGLKLEPKIAQIKVLHVDEFTRNPIN
jgi:uncharacterized protein (TIGR03435 family)